MVYYEELWATSPPESHWILQAGQERLRSDNPHVVRTLLPVRRSSLMLGPQ